MNLAVFLASIVVTGEFAYLTLAQHHHGPWYVSALILSAVVSLALLTGPYWRP